MRALLLDGAPRVVSDYPEPVRRAGEALIRVRLAGVCDTDLQLAKGYMGFRGILGHEFVGEVLESDDPKWSGRRVVADINAGCGECDDCRTRDGHHCARRTVLGILGRDGAFAERLVVPERCLFAVPDELDDTRAAFAEPAAAALHVLDEVAAKTAGSAIVVGDGKLGQLIARALLTAGIPTTLIGHHKAKLDLLRDTSATLLLEEEVDPGVTSPFVVEATGSPKGLARAIGLTEPRGTVVLKTTVKGASTADLSKVVIDELRIVGSRCGSMRTAIEALARRALDPISLVEARYPLSRADEALARAEQKGALKILVDCA